MNQGIARFTKSLLRLLLPASRRRRCPVPTPTPLDTVTGCVPQLPAPRGEDIGPVRPYVAAAARHHEEQHQRARWRTSWLEEPSIIDTRSCPIPKGEMPA